MSKKESKTAEKTQKKKIKVEYLATMNEALQNSPLLKEIKAPLPEFEEAKATIVKMVELPEETKEMLAEMAEAFAKMDKFLQSDEYTTFKEQARRLTAFIEEHRAELTAQSDAERLAPFLQLELESSTEYAQYVLEDIIERYAEGGKITDKQINRIIERAKKRQADFEEAREVIEEAEQVQRILPQIIANPTNLLEYPLDKPNSRIWKLLANADENGQLSLEIDTAPEGKKAALIYYSIDFKELENDITITKKLTPFDKLVYIAAGALWNAGNQIITASQIYRMMGYDCALGKADREKINKSLDKMGRAHVYINNEHEIKTLRGYAHFYYDAALLPFERVSVYINGKLTESAIKLFREPPLISFAKERKQVTTISRQLLAVPKSNTETAMLINDYLLDRIGHMKRPKSKAPRKMLYATIYEMCNITTKKQKQRAPEKIQICLDHYKKCGWIKDYHTDKESITIEL